MPTPLQTYRTFSEYLRTGQYGRLAEVVDTDNYVENCVGLTGWTIGLNIALTNFTQGIATALSDGATSEEDVVETAELGRDPRAFGGHPHWNVPRYRADRSAGQFGRGRLVPGRPRWPYRLAVPAMRLERGSAATPWPAAGSATGSDQRCAGGGKLCVEEQPLRHREQGGGI